MQKKANVARKIVPVIGDCTSLHFSDNSFDIVYSAWVLQSIDNLKAAVKEMVRVTKPKGAIIIILASGQGDETKVRDFLESNATKDREERIKTIKKILKQKCKVKEKREILYFHFSPRVDKVYEILVPITLKIKNYLSRRFEKLKTILRN